MDIIYRYGAYDSIGIKQIVPDGRTDGFADFTAGGVIDLDRQVAFQCQQMVDIMPAPVGMGKYHFSTHQASQADAHLSIAVGRKAELIGDMQANQMIRIGPLGALGMRFDTVDHQEIRAGHAGYIVGHFMIGSR